MKTTDDDRSVMTAVTFAEAGEFETARSYAPPPRKGRIGAWVERHLMAAAFAEEGSFDEARRLCGAPLPRPEAQEDVLESLLLAGGVRMFCGVLSPAVLATRADE